MGKVKKAGVCAGIAVGSLIGGTVSMIGKMTDRKVIDDLGENIMDSTILTGEIVGDAASGAANLISGTIRKEPKKIRKGKKELGKAGGQVVENVFSNVKNVAEQSGEILEGVKDKDKKRVCKGVQTLGRMMVVGLLTVGAIKIDDKEGEEAERLMQTELDAEPETGIDSEIGQNAENGFAALAEAGAGATSGLGSDVQSGAGSGAASGAGSGVEAEAGSASEAGAGAAVGSASGAASGSDVQSGEGSGAASDAGSAVEAEVGAASRSGTSASANSDWAEPGPAADAPLPEPEDLSMESLLEKQPTLEEVLEKTIRF